MLRRTLAVAILAGAAASGTAAMAGSGAPNSRGTVAVVADNAAPTAPVAKDPLSSDQTEKFREEVRQGKHNSVTAKVDVKVGTVLPDNIEFYAMGPQWNMSDYKYALVNDKTVIVDTKSRRIVQVLATTKDVTKAKKGTADH